MKYVTSILLLVLCLMGGITMRELFLDKPQYAEGEPTSIVKNWLAKQPAAASTPAGTTRKEIPENTTWVEDYLGSGKWQVTQAVLSSGYSESELTFEEWIAQTKGWDANRLKEYASDLSPEDEEAYNEHLRAYDPGHESLNVLEQWYLYEKSGLIEPVVK